MSLIEVIVASAILLLVSAGVMDLYIHILREHARTTALNQMRQQSRLVLQALSRDLARAESVQLPSSQNKPEKNLVSPVLSLSLSDDARRTEKITYFYRNGKIERRAEVRRKKQDVTQVLADSAAAFRCQRKDGLLHVQVQCTAQHARQPLTSTLETDFYIGGSK